ncbi:hypothetical protein [Nonomuraea sp. CA-141351]|uniref:hypothetical protein n=1 Tax=Nonomuraea sp. CA-141351 TaxID=3239996 RepID=UPI003D942CCC
MNPSTGEVVGTYVSAGRAEAQAAIAAARTAFDTTTGYATRRCEPGHSTNWPTGSPNASLPWAAA